MDFTERLGRTYGTVKTHLHHAGKLGLLVQVLRKGGDRRPRECVIANDSIITGCLSIIWQIVNVTFSGRIRMPYYRHRSCLHLFLLRGIS